MAVKSGQRPYSPVSSKASSESEMILKAQEQYLTTILERTETNTLETLERIRRAEAAPAGPPPVHARVRVVNKACAFTFNSGGVFFGVLKKTQAKEDSTSTNFPKKNQGKFQENSISGLKCLHFRHSV